MANLFFVEGDLTNAPFKSEFINLSSEIPELSVSVLRSEEFLYAVKSYCSCGRYPCGDTDSDKKLVLVMGMTDAVVAEKVLSIVDSPLSGVAVPRIIFLSSLLTWAGKRYDMSGVNVWDEKSSYEAVGEGAFFERQPLPGLFELYSLENKLTSTTNAEVSIIGLGCIYGGSGYDFEQIFKDVWNYGIGEESTKVKLKSMLAGENKVPSIHYADLARALVAIVSYEGTLPKFLPASNCANISLNETVSSILSHVNGEPVSPSEGLQYLTQSELAQEMIQGESADTPNALLWSTDLSFEADWVKKYTGSAAIGGRGILDSLDSVWTEFLTCHNLRPVSAFIAGPPQAGKTSVCKSIQSTFKCQYVDVPTAISFVLKTQMAENSAGSLLKGEIMAIVEAKAAEGKKPPKKGEPEEPVEVDPATVEVNEQLIDAISPELKRKSLSLMITSDKLCLRRGYVMDIWDSGIITCLADMVEIMTKLSPPSPVKDVTESGDASPGGEAATADAPPPQGEEQAEELNVAEPESKITVFPELMIEIQCSDEVLMARLHAAQGIENGDMKKASKEAQAAVKDFETKLSAYTTLVEAIPVPEPEASPEATQDEEKTEPAPQKEPVEPEFTHTHKVLLELNSSESNTISSVFRVKSDDRTIEEVTLISSQELAATHGEIGWISEETKANLVKPTSIDKEPVTSGAEEAKTSEAGTNDVDAEAQNAAPSKDEQDQLALYNDMCKIVGGVKESVREDMVSKAVKLQDFLMANVMTEVSQIMIEIVQKRPEDPLMMMADRLDEIAAERERVARDKAEKRFYDLLARAEAGEIMYEDGK